MKAMLHLISGEATQISIDLPEAKALAGAHINIYSNIDHVLWEATQNGKLVQHVSRIPNPAHSLKVLATLLRSAQAASVH